MACFYTLRLPVAPGVTADRLLTALAVWLTKESGHAFPEIKLRDLTTPIEISAPQARLMAASAQIGAAFYTAVRLQSDTALSPALLCPENLQLTADFMVEEQADLCFLTLQLHSAPLDPQKPAAFPQFILPEILWQLAENGLLADDCGLPMRPTPLAATPQFEKALLPIRSGTAFPARPLLLVREGNYALTPRLASKLCQCLHVVVLPGMHPALSGLGAGSARILFPRFQVSRPVDLTAPSACEDILEYAARLTALAIPADLPSFALIQALCGQQIPSSAAYLCVNRRMADSIRFHRLKNGLTQAELAKKTGTTGLLISRLENCRPARVRESLIVSIEEALHLKNREILACEGLSAPEASGLPRPAFCPICGTKTAETGDFCTGCGCKLC